MREPRMADTARADRPLREVALGGGLSGIVAGLLMALAGMLASAAREEGFWTPLRLIGATLYGPDALSLGAAPVVVGLLLHLLVSAFWAVLFSFTVRPDTPVAGSFTTGLIYGVVVWAIMTFTIVPWADPLLATRLADFGTSWFGLHLLYGAGLAVTPIMERIATGGLALPPRPA
jgi:hypothetical protein